MDLFDENPKLKILLHILHSVILNVSMQIIRKKYSPLKLTKYTSGYLSRHGNSLWSFHLDGYCLWVLTAHFFAKLFQVHQAKK